MLKRFLVGNIMFTKWHHMLVSAYEPEGTTSLPPNLHQARTRQLRKKRARESGVRKALKASAANADAELPITFCQRLQKRTTTNRSPLDRTTRRRPHGWPQSGSAMPSANGGRGLGSAPAPACAKRTRKATSRRCAEWAAHTGRFFFRFWMLPACTRCLNASAKPNTGKWCRRRRQEMRSRTIILILMLKHASWRPPLQPAPSGPKQSWCVASPDAHGTFDSARSIK